jgi:hypothetical protein
MKNKKSPLFGVPGSINPVPSVTSIFRSMITLIFASVIVLSGVSIVSADSGDSQSDWRKYYVELSFGNSILFLEQGYQSDATSTKKQTLPVASYLFHLQYRALEHMSFGVAWNLPSSTVKKVDSGGKTYEKFVAPSYGVGVTFPIHTFVLTDSTNLEPELGILVFRTYKSESSKGDFFFPLGVWKMNLTRSSGLTMYIGVSQAPAKNTTALIYGIGQRF